MFPWQANVGPWVDRIVKRWNNSGQSTDGNACWVFIMRTICLLAAAAILLAACATAPHLQAGGQGGGRYSKGTAGVGIPF
jgi:hypothetical protein